MPAPARILTLTLLIAALPVASARAVPDCPSPPHARTLLSGQGVLESIAGDARGRLFLSQLAAGNVLRLDRPGGRATVLTAGIDAPGGLVMDGAGRLVAGFGDSIEAGTADDGQAGLLRIDTDTGQSRLIVRGLGMANGVARGPDGALYATNDFGGDVDRVLGGRVEPDWARVASSNGVAVDRAGRFLYVAQTFTAPVIQRVDLRDPSQVTPYAAGSASDASAVLDGMARDGADRLYVAANAAGEVWRVDRDRSICALVRGLRNPSSVSFGGGGRFPARNLYVVAFSGVVVALADATDRPPAPPARGRLRLTASSRRVAAGRSVKITFVVTQPGVKGRRPAAGASVRFGGELVRADSAGRAVIEHRFSIPRLARARASLEGLSGARAFVRVAR